MRATSILRELGQSLWLDNISRDLLENGKLEYYIREFSVSGLTSNPTIFERAFKTSTAYDSAILREAVRGTSAEDSFFELALDDLTRAADLLRPIFERSDGVDGWVSLEVSPLLAREAYETVVAAKNLFARAGRPNLMIKIPGTKECLPAIEELIYSGVPVNVTLLFSREHYLGAAEAYLRGIERRIQSGLRPDIHSVASVFVSRWDAAMASKITKPLRNRLGIAMAQRIYQAARSLLSSPRWHRTYNFGARPQRVLWASTGTKDPTAPKSLYVDSLAAPFTVNTMPEDTINALAQSTMLSKSFITSLEDCEQVLAEFVAAGIDLDKLGARLQNDGTNNFVDSWNELMAVLEFKAAMLHKDRTLRAAS
jgi:transaldolase